MLVYDKAPALLTKAEFIEKYNPRDVYSYDTRSATTETQGDSKVVKLSDIRKKRIEDGFKK